MQQVLDENHRIDVLKAIWQKEDQEENKDRPTWFDDDEWSGWGSD